MKVKQLEKIKDKITIEGLNAKKILEGSEDKTLYSFMSVKICKVMEMKNRYMIEYNFPFFSLMQYVLKKKDISKNIIKVFEDKMYNLSPEEVKAINRDPYITFKEYDTEELLPYIGRNDKVILEDKYKVNFNSIRLNTFIVSGVKCKHCGREGKIFKLQVHKRSSDINPHLNLYSDDGVMMTSDHINPISKSDDNSLENRQTLCSICNTKKSDKIEGEEE